MPSVLSVHVSSCQSHAVSRGVGRVGPRTQEDGGGGRKSFPGGSDLHWSCRKGRILTVIEGKQCNSRTEHLWVGHQAPLHAGGLLTLSPQILTLLLNKGHAVKYVWMSLMSPFLEMHRWSPYIKDSEKYRKEPCFTVLLD